MTLSDLLPSTPYLLAYSLPLLFISLPLAFAGAFLTLDRTRVFTPRKDVGYESTISGVHKARRKLLLMMEGGIGGLAGGYLFGRTSFPLSTEARVDPGFSSSFDFSRPLDTRCYDIPRP
jgi:hypothetical protein